MLKLTLIVPATFLTSVLGLSSCAERQITQGLTYPQGLSRGTTLNIQVIRKSTRIELTNTTARAFGPFTLWLNGRFSQHIDAFAIGQTLTLTLRDFKDEFGERFRGGGFFAADKPELLILAEINPDNSTEMLGLIVVRSEE